MRKSGAGVQVRLLDGEIFKMQVEGGGLSLLDLSVFGMSDMFSELPSS